MPSRLAGEETNGKGDWEWGSDCCQGKYPVCKRMFGRAVWKDSESDVGILKFMVDQFLDVEVWGLPWIQRIV